MVFCSQGMQQYVMHNATIQKTTFFELRVYMYFGVSKEIMASIFIYEFLYLKSGNIIRGLWMQAVIVFL